MQQVTLRFALRHRIRPSPPPTLPPSTPCPNPRDRTRALGFLTASPYSQKRISAARTGPARTGTGPLSFSEQARMGALGEGWVGVCSRDAGKFSASCLSALTSKVEGRGRKRNSVPPGSGIKRRRHRSLFPAFPPCTDRDVRAVGVGEKVRGGLISID